MEKYIELYSLLMRCRSLLSNRLEEVRNNGQSVANMKLIKQIRRLELIQRQLINDFFETL